MLKIRQATLTDLETLLEFEQLLIDYERNLTSHIKEGNINYYDIESFIKKPDAIVIVAETNGEIIGSGYALIKTNKTYKIPEKYVYLGFMYVKEEHRGKGINKRILDHCLISHLSTEPGHAKILDILNKEPILDLKLRLGEGSGAATASLILKAAIATHNGMATFTDAKVSKN